MIEETGIYRLSETYTTPGGRTWPKSYVFNVAEITDNGAVALGEILPLNVPADKAE